MFLKVHIFLVTTSFNIKFIPIINMQGQMNIRAMWGVSYVQLRSVQGVIYRIHHTRSSQN